VRPAQLSQRAIIAPTENGELARLAPDQRSSSGKNIYVAASGAQQPSADIYIERFANRLKRSGNGRNATREALMKSGQRMGSR
jgi:hypothetical protein